MAENTVGGSEAPEAYVNKFLERIGQRLELSVEDYSTDEDMCDEIIFNIGNLHGLAEAFYANKAAEEEKEDLSGVDTSETLNKSQILTNQK